MFSIISILFIIKCVRIVADYEPYSLINKEKLIALFDFNSGYENEVKYLDDLNSVRYVKVSNVYDITHSSEGHTGNCYYFNGNSYMNLSINLNPLLFPRLSIGAWIKLSSNDTRSLDYKYIFSNNYLSSDCQLGLFISDNYSPCSNDKSNRYSTSPKFDVWQFVAIVYDHFESTAKLYIDNEIYEYSNINLMNSMGNLIIGSLFTNSPGFHGYLDDVFIYSDTLDYLQLRFLQDYNLNRIYRPIARNSGSSIMIKDGFGMVIPALPNFSNYSDFGIMVWIKLVTIANLSDFIVIDKSNNGLEYKIVIKDDFILSSRWITVYLGQNEYSLWEYYWNIEICNVTYDWFHLGISKNNKNINIYINGSLIQSISVSYSIFIQDYSSSIYIGKIHESHQSESPVGFLDDFALWNDSIDSIITSIYAHTLQYNRSLVLYLQFNENFGLLTKSSVLVDNVNVNAFWNPIYNIVDQKFADDYWISSNPPIDVSITTKENTPIVIKLNGSDSLSSDLFYCITTYPTYGLLYNIPDIDRYITGYSNSFVSSSYPMYGNLITIDNNNLTSNYILYIPDFKYVGLDEFYFNVYNSRNLSAEFNGYVMISVDSSSYSNSIYLSNSSLALGSFSVLHSDYWSTLSERFLYVSIYCDSTYNNVLLSLNSLQGLQMDGSIGKFDKNMTFLAYSDNDLTNAISSLNLNLPKQLYYRLNLTLHVDIIDRGISNDDSISQTSKLSLPIQMALSSIPIIDYVNPTVVTAASNNTDVNSTCNYLFGSYDRKLTCYNDRHIEIFGKHFSNDVSFCSYNNTVSSVIYISPNQINCLIPTSLNIGEYRLTLFTKAGLSSNYIVVYVVDNLDLVSISPSYGRYNVYNNIAITVSEIISSTVYCLIDNDQYTNGNVISSTKVTCIVPPFDKFTSSHNISICYNLIDKPKTFITYTSINLLTIEYLEPSIIYTYISSYNSVVIKLHGNGFRKEMGDYFYCLIDNSYKSSTTVYISDRVIACEFTNLYLISGDYFLYYSINGFDLSNSNSLLRLVSDISLQSVFPTVLYTYYNSTSIMIYGFDFNSAVDYYCIFTDVFDKNISSLASYVSESLVSCICPIILYPTIYSLSIGTYNGNYINIISKTNFTINYINYPEVASIYPSIYMNSTDSIEYSIIGNYFMGDNYKNVRVILESRNDSSFNFTFIGNVISNYIVTFTIDNCFNNVSIGEYNLLLYIENTNSTINSFLSIFAVDKPILSDVNCLNGPTQGGTDVYLYGLFVDVSIIYCIFHDIFVIGNYINESTIYCQSPRFDNSLYVPLGISYDVSKLTAVYYKSNFFYTKSLILSDSNPWGSNIYSDNNITIYSSYVSITNVYCRYNHSILISGYYLSNKIIVCPSIVSYFNISYGIMDVDITYNKQQYSNSIEYFYWNPISITNVSSDFITTNNDSLIKLTLSERISNNQIKCVIQSNYYLPYMTSDNTVICRLNGYLYENLINNFTLGISVNDFSTEDFRYIYIYNSINQISGDISYLIDLYQYNISYQIDEINSELIDAMKSTDTFCIYNSTFHFIATIDVSTLSITCMNVYLQYGVWYLSIISNGVLVSNFTSFVIVYEEPYFLADISKKYYVNTNNDILITCNNLFGNISYYCLVNNNKTMGIYVNSSFISCPLYIDRAGLNVLFISYNNVNYFPTNPLLFIEYEDDITIYPINRYISNESSVEIYINSYITAYSSYRCLFNDSIVDAIIISVNQINCDFIAKNKLEDGQCISFALMSNEVKLIEDLFYYYNIPGIISIYPSQLTTFKRNDIVIKLSDTTVDLNMIYCVLNEVFVPCYHVSAFSYSCSITYSITGYVDIYTSINGIDIFNSYFKIKFVNSPKVLRIDSYQGPISGNSFIEILGSNMIEELSCKIGENIGELIYFNDTYVQCVSPSQKTSGIYLIYLSINQYEYISTGLYFTYYDIINITSIFPSFGTELGGFDININLPNSLSTNRIYYCVFDTFKLKTTANYKSTNILSCNVPSHKPGKINFGLTLNGYQYSSSLVTFTFTIAHSVYMINPSFGSIYGGTNILIYGSNFQSTISLSCRFGNQIVSATYISNTEINCVSPISFNSTINSVTVDVSLNGIDFSNSRVFYSYITTTLIYKISPTFGIVTGGNNISVYLTNSREFKILKCKINDIYISGIISYDLNKFTCLIPDLSRYINFVINELQEINVEVLDSNYLVLNSFSYYLHQIPSFFSVYPSTVFSNTKYFYITGINYPSIYGNIICKIGDTVSNGFLLSTNEIKCLSKLQKPSNISISVSFNSYDFIDTNLAVQFFNNLIIESYYPPKIMTSGGQIYITSKDFSLYDNIDCLLNNELIIPINHYFNSTTVGCFLPNYQTGKYSLDISINSKGITNSQIYIEYVNIPFIDSIHPIMGPMSGGTYIDVYGKKFMEGMLCRFDYNITDAIYYSDSYIRCISPIQTCSNAISARIFLSINKQEFFDSGFSFNYFKYPEILSIDPTIVPEVGNTKLHILFNEPVPEYIIICQFGSFQYRVIGYKYNERTVVCITPAHLPESVDLQISFNHQNFYSILSNFRFLESPKILTVSPNIGYNSGGFKIDISGLNFINETTLTCLFGHKLSAAYYVSSTLIQCVCPPTSYQGDVNLLLSYQNISYQSSKSIFTYLNTPVITSLLPSVGKYSNETLVKIYGENFPDKITMKCLFGDKFSNIIYQSINEIHCFSPSYSKIYGTVSVRLSVDILGLTESIGYYTYLDTLDSNGIFPIIGPDIGGWPIQIYFRNNLLGFQFIYEDIFCFFNDNIMSSAIFVSDILSCEVPSLESGSYLVTLSNSDKSLLYYLDEILIIPSIQMISIFPNTLLIGNEQFIYVLVNNMYTIFYDTFSSNISSVADIDICCEFNGAIVRAQNFNTSIVTCLAPGFFAEGSANVRVVYCNAYSPNDNSYKLNFLSLNYISSPVVETINPTNGFYIGGSNIYIEGKGFNSNSIFICKFTYYNDSIIVIASLISELQIICKSPSVTITNGFANISLYVNSTESNPITSSIFRYYDIPVIKSYFPTSGEETDHNEIVMILDSLNFYDTLSSITCMFDNTISSFSTVIYDFKGLGPAILCIAPEHSPMIVSVYISVNQYDFYDTGLKYMYTPITTLEYVSPKYISDSHTILTLYGTNLNYSTSLCCYFKIFGGLSPAVQLSDSKIQCNLSNVLQQTFGYYHEQLTISLNCVKPITDFIEIYKFDVPMNINVYPQLGSFNGGTKLFISAENINVSGHISCKFNDYVIDGYFASSYLAICEVPNYEYFNSVDYVNDYSTTNFAISLDNKFSFISTNMNVFTYISDPIINDLTPKVVVERQPFTVLLTGYFNQYLDIKHNLKCRFGKLTYDLYILSNESALCDISTYTVSPDKYIISLSINGQDFFDSTDYINVIPSLSVIKISPVTLFSTDDIQVISFFLSVSLNNQLVLNNNSTICKLNNTIYHSIIESSFNQINCIINSHLLAGNYNISIFSLLSGQLLINISSIINSHVDKFIDEYSNNYIVRYLSDSVTVLDFPKIISVYPTTLSLDISTYVNIFGIFDESDNYICIHRYSSSYFQIPVFTNSTLIICLFDITFISKNYASESFIYTSDLFLSTLDNNYAIYLTTLTLLPSININNIEPKIIIVNKEYNLGIYGSNFYLTKTCNCLINSRIYDIFFYNSSYLECLNVSVDNIGSFKVAVSIDFENYIYTNISLLASIDSTIFIHNYNYNNDQVIYCPSKGSKYGIILTTSDLAFYGLLDKFYCFYEGINIIFEPIIKNNLTFSTVYCPCPDIGKFYSNNGISYNDIVNVSFSLNVYHMIHSYLTGIIQYYDEPEFHISNYDRYFLTNVSSQLNISVINYWNDYNKFPLIYPQFHSSKSSSLHLIEFSCEWLENNYVIGCDVKCFSNSDIDNSVILDISFDSINFYLVSNIYCYSTQPTIYLYDSPQRYVESSNILLDIPVLNLPISDVMKCHLNDQSYSIIMSNYVYNNNIKHTLVKCDIPSYLNPGNYILIISTSRLFSNTISIEIISKPQIISYYPKSLPISTTKTDLDRLIYIIFSYPFNYDNEVGYCNVNNVTLVDWKIGINSSTIICDLAGYLFANSFVDIVFYDVTIFTYELNVYTIPIIDSLSSTIAFININNSIVVYTNPKTSLYNYDQYLYCNFTDNLRSYFTEISILNSSSLICNSPIITISTVTYLSISLDKLYHSNHLLYFFIQSLHVISYNPKFGSTDGGTMVKFNMNSDQVKYLSTLFTYSCMFDSIYVLAVLDVKSNTINCAAPKVDYSNTVYISLLINSNLVSKTYFPYYYHEIPTLLSVHPTEVSIYGDKYVFLQIGSLNINYLRKFNNQSSNSNSIFCLFGKKIVNGEFFNESIIKCLSPSILISYSSVTNNYNESIYEPLKFSLNGIDYFGDKSLKYTFLPIASSIYPTHGPYLISESIDVNGDGFRIDQLIHCMFNDIKVLARFVSNKLIRCDLPKSNQSNIYGYEVSLILNKSQKLSTSFTFVYDNDIAIDTVNPEILTQTDVFSNQNYLTITGNGFVNYRELSCELGGIYLNAFFISKKSIICILPNIINSGNYLLSITMNGRDYYSHENKIIIYEDFFVMSINPSYGFINIFSNVSVYISQFHANYEYVCLFDDFSLNGVIMNDHIICNIRHQISLYNSIINIKIHNVNLSISTSNSMKYTFINDIIVDNLYPMLGPSEGNGLVFISIKQPQLHLFKRIYCKFDDNISEGFIDSIENLITCKTAKLALPGDNFYRHVSLSISIDNLQNFQQLSVNFLIYNHPEIYELYPSKISIATTTFILVRGSNYSNLYPWYCKIGLFQSIALNIDNKALSCRVYIAIPGIYDLFLSHNNYDWFNSGKAVFVKDTIEIISIYPKEITLNNTSNISISLCCFELSEVNSAISIMLQSMTTNYRRIILGYVANITTVVFKMPDWIRVDNLVLSMVSNEQSNELSYISSNVSISLVEPFIISSIYPLFAIYNPKSEIILSLSHYLPNYILQELVIHLLVDSDILNLEFVVVNNSTLRLMAPSNLENYFINIQNLPIYISIYVPSRDYFTPEVSFVYFRMIEFISVKPLTLTEAGGLFLIEGDFPSIFDKLLCKLGNSNIFNGEIISSRLIQCNVQNYSVSQNVSISISFSEGYDWIDINDFKLAFIPKYKLESINPNRGPNLGGTNITISTNNVISNLNDEYHSNFYCSFDGIETSTIILSNNTISCVSPPLLHIFNKNIEIKLILRYVSSKQTNYFNTSFSFYVYGDINLYSINPSSGFSFGGTTVTMKGSGFFFVDSYLPIVKVSSISDLSVYSFGEVNYIDDETISMITPSNPNGLLSSGYVYISLSMNGQDFTASTLLFHYVNGFIITGFYPNSIYESDFTRDSLVIQTDHSNFERYLYIQGSGFYDTFPNQIKCRYMNSIYSSGSYLSDSVIRCPIPSLKPDFYTIEVSMNGEDYLRVGIIEFKKLPILLSMYPTFGTISGGTNITFKIYNFNSSDRLNCKFEDIITKAYSIDKTSWYCNSPYLNFSNYFYDKILGLNDSKVQLSNNLSNGDLVYTSGVNVLNYQELSNYLLSPITVRFTFEIVSFSVKYSPNYLAYIYIDDPIIKSVSQNSGPSSGGSEIILSGYFPIYEYLVDSAGCRFGDKSNMFVNASFYNSTVVVCDTPLDINMKSDIDLDILPIYLTFNQRDYLNIGWTFTYYRSVVLSKIYPSSGSIYGGLTTILQGNFIYPSINSKCFFGLIYTNVKYVSANTIQCVTPMSSRIGNVSIGYAHNGIDIEWSNLSFNYFSGPGIISNIPSTGSITGKTKIIVECTNLFLSNHWYCMFDRYISTKATYLYKNSIQCHSPTITDAKISVLEVILLTNYTSDTVFIQNDLLSMALIANGHLDFTYYNPIEIISVNPCIMYKRGDSSVYVTTNNLNHELAQNLSCIWGDHLHFTGARYSTDNLIVECITPRIIFDKSRELPLSLAISYNGYIETLNQLTVIFIDDPGITGLKPYRSVSNTNNSKVTIFASNIYQHNASCVYTHGDIVLDIIPIDKNYYPNQTYVQCDLPSTLPSFRDTQKLTISSAERKYEIQSIEITHLPIEPRIIDISTSSWGSSNTIFSINRFTYLNPSNRDIYSLSLSSNPIPEIQEILIQSVAYKQEIQKLHLYGTIKYLNELYFSQDSGIVYLNVRNKTISIYWNITAIEFEYIVNFANSYSNITIVKSYNESSIPSTNLLYVSIEYIIKYGIADGNVSLIEIENYDIPRAVEMYLDRFTIIDGIACEIQDISIYNSKYGYFRLLMEDVETEDISIDSSLINIKNIILSTYPLLIDVIVEKYSFTYGYSQFLIYFIGKPGKISKFELAFSNLTSWDDSISPYLLINVFVSSQSTNVFGHLKLLDSFIDISAISLDEYILIDDRIQSVTYGKYYSDSTYHVIITFGAEYGDVELLVIGSSQIYGSYPSVQILEVQKGINLQRELISMHCLNGFDFNSNLSFTIGYSDINQFIDSNSNFVNDISIDSFQNAIYRSNYISKFSIDLDKSNHYLNWTINISSIMYKSNNSCWIEIIIPPKCSDGTNADVNINKLTHGLISDITGYIGVSASLTKQSTNSLFLTTSSTNIYEYLPFDSLENYLPQLFLDLGLGNVNIAKSETTFLKNITYIMEFTELLDYSEVNTLDISLQYLNSNGYITVSWNKLQSQQSSCCLNDETFNIHNNFYNLTSSLLSKNSSNIEISQALVDIKLVDSLSKFSIRSINHPSNGISWIIDVTNLPNKYIEDKITISEILILKSKSPLLLNGQIEQTKSGIEVLANGTVCMIQRLTVQSYSLLSGHFSLSLYNKTTNIIDINITPERFVDELIYTFLFDSVSVIPITEDNIIGDYRSWDIYLTSTSGNIDLFQCNSTSILGLFTYDIICNVIVHRNATSSPIEGYFTISTDADISVSVPYDISSNDLTKAIEKLINIVVKITRYINEYDNGYTWSITYLTFSDIYPNLYVGSYEKLSGTSVFVDLSISQLGFFPCGRYRLSNGNEYSSYLYYNSSDADLQLAVESFPNIGSVTVSSDISLIGRRYLVTFVGNQGDINLLTFEVDNNIIADEYLNSYINVYINEIQQGIPTMDLLDYSFDVSYPNEDYFTSIYSNTSITNIRQQLTKSNFIGDITVSKSMDLIHNRVDYLFTFTTIGSPSNGGNVPLLIISNFVSSYQSNILSNISVIIEKEQIGCCDIYISNNYGRELSKSHTSIIIDHEPILLSIYPISGSINGGINITVTGSGFLTCENPIMHFDNSIVDIVIVNDTYGYCINPPHLSGKVLLRFQSDRFIINSVTRSNIIFIYLPDLVIQSIQPNVGQLYQLTLIQFQVTNIDKI